MIFLYFVVVGLDLLNIASERDNRIAHVYKFLHFFNLLKKSGFWFLFAFLNAHFTDTVHFDTVFRVK